MGVGEAVKISELPTRGSLLKLINIPVCDFKNETFRNIGAFTVEHLEQIILKVKGEPTAIHRKDKFEIENTNPNEQVYMIVNKFYLYYLSHGLIYISGMFQLRIIENTIFDNIWLIDRANPFIAVSGDEAIPDYGLLLYLKNFIGFLIIGKEGSESVSGVG